MAPRKRLTEKQRIFLDAYFTHGGPGFLNATGAARMAGYGDPEKDGWRTRQKPYIRSLIDEWMRAESERLRRRW